MLARQDLPHVAVLCRVNKVGFSYKSYRAGNRKPNVDNMAKQGHIRHIFPSKQKPSHHNKSHIIKATQTALVRNTTIKQYDDKQC